MILSPSLIAPFLGSSLNRTQLTSCDSKTIVTILIIGRLLKYEIISTVNDDQTELKLIPMHEHLASFCAIFVH